jgi:uncharacterized Tic20 family protein
MLNVSWRVAQAPRLRDPARRVMVEEAHVRMSSPSDNSQNGAQYIMRSPSLGERLIAVTTHLLILVSLPGIVITAIIWMLARGSSPYVRHHARSAMRWQLFENFIILGSVAVFLIVIVGAGFWGRNHSEANALNTAFAAGIGIILVFAIPAAIFAIPAVVGAFRALLPGSFRYPLTSGKTSSGDRRSANAPTSRS